MDVFRLFARNANRTRAVSAPETKSASERIEGALRRVPLLENCPDAVRRIMDQGEFGRIDGGRTFIRTGEYDEDVYFLIAGRVRITWRETTLHEWAAPEVVGELSPAMHRPRSANVTALEGGITYLKITGSEFRSIIQEFPEVRTRLEVRKDEMLQARIPRSNSCVATTSWLRGVIALVTGFAAAAVSTVLMTQFGIIGKANYVFSSAVGALVMILVMILSPALIFRSVGISAGLSAIFIATGWVPYARFETDGTLLPGIDGVFSLGQSFTGSEALFAMIVLALIAVIFLWASFKAQNR